MNKQKFYLEAEAAYNAYCDKRKWKSVKGDALPKFGDQSPELQEAWEAAALACINKYMEA